MDLTKRLPNFVAILSALAWISAGANTSYADDFESQLLDDLIERATPAVETAPRPDEPPPPAGPLASAAEDMRLAAEAMRGVTSSDWDAAVAAQDAALAKLRQLLQSADAAAGRLQVASAAQEDPQSASQAEAAGDPPPAPGEERADPGEQPSGTPNDPPAAGESPQGQQSGESSGEGQQEEGGPGRSPSQTGGPDTAAGGGTAAAAPRDEAADVRLREALDRWQKMQWGMLPPRLREQVGGGGAAEFAEGYERPTAAYVEELGRRLEGQSP